MAEKKKNIDRKDADFDSAALSRNPEEYTFQPNAHKRKSIVGGGSPRVKRNVEKL